MPKKLKDFFQFLQTDVRDLITPKETVETGIESAKAVLELAKTLQEQGPNLTAIAPYVSNISTLLVILNNPWMQVVGAGLSFVAIGSKLLTIYVEKTKKEPTLAQCAVITVQAAYLASFQDVFSQPDKQELLGKIGQASADTFQSLGDLELSNQEACLSVIYFQDSLLAGNFNSALLMRLEKSGVSETDAITLTQQVSSNTRHYIQSVLSELGEKVKPLVQWFQVEGHKNLEKHYSINIYLKEVIETKPLETIFNEEITFQDIYVPLQAQLLKPNGDVVKNDKNDQEVSSDPVDLEDWVKTFLNQKKSDKVIFIQGGPGRGKSVFCRMFADWLRQTQYPQWIPILIRLRDINHIDKNFEETLRQAVDRDFAKNDDGWLTDRNFRYVFLLDGFDELLMQGRTAAGLEDFLTQVGKFQESCARNSEKQHQVLITGRPLALQSIDRRLPLNLERVELLPMNETLQEQWLGNWQKWFGEAEVNNFRNFLQNDRCPEQVRELAKEPLLLYLLAAMHRDKKLTANIFEGADSISAKILIYQESLDWVLTTQRPAWLNRDITELETEGLKTILSEAALCVVQSGTEWAAVKTIEERLKDNSNAQALLTEAEKHLSDKPLRNALTAFYLQPGRAKGEGGSVEFMHKSFGEFLFANRLKESLEDWAQSGDRRKEFYVSKEEMDEEVYDLLGYDGLSVEIVEYLTGLITESHILRKTENFERLFQRLEKFYLRWWQGEFMDAAVDDPQRFWPQKKMRLQVRGGDSRLGLRQIDVITGLNTLILLLELNRYAQEKDDLKDKIQFYPCGKPDGNDFEKDRLLKLSGYSSYRNLDTFCTIVGNFLSGANLSEATLNRANLNEVDFSGTNLSEVDFSEVSLMRANLVEAELSGTRFWDANLISANLQLANLIGADLRRTMLLDANLIGADLRGADLRGADLRGTRLLDANLIGADLRGADLRGADLCGADLCGADLTNIWWGLDQLYGGETNWNEVRNLDMAKNMPTKLKKRLGIDSVQD